MIESSVLGLSPVGFHRIAYTQWGRRDSGRTVICLHGLTRNGRDFDWLASALMQDRWVVCPDFAGRGRSDWLPDPALYDVAQYLSDLVALIARLDVEEVDVVGTSLGGIVGMLLASQANSPVRRLVVNDVGPVIASEGLARIRGNVGKTVVFEDMAGLEAYLRFALISIGSLSDRHWHNLAQHSARRLADGRFALAYDPAIAVRFAEKPTGDVDPWPMWRAIRCPVLILRGENSDVLSAGIADEMMSRAPNARLVSIAGVGHAPALTDEAQIRLVRDFLDEA